MTRGRASLLQKDKSKGNVASHYQKSRKGAGKVLEELMIDFIFIGQ